MTEDTITVTWITSGNSHLDVLWMLGVNKHKVYKLHQRYILRLCVVYIHMPDKSYLRHFRSLLPCLWFCMWQLLSVITSHCLLIVHKHSRPRSVSDWVLLILFFVLHVFISSNLAHQCVFWFDYRQMEVERQERVKKRLTSHIPEALQGGWVSFFSLCSAL